MRECLARGRIIEGNFLERGFEFISYIANGANSSLLRNRGCLWLQIANGYYFLISIITVAQRLISAVMLYIRSIYIKSGDYIAETNKVAFDFLYRYIYVLIISQ